MESEKKYFIAPVISITVLPVKGSSVGKIEKSETSSFDICVSTSKVLMVSISSPKNSTLSGSSDVEGETSNSHPRLLYSPFSTSQKTPPPPLLERGGKGGLLPFPFVLLCNI